MSMQNMIQRAVQHAVQHAVTKAVEKAISVKAQKAAQADGREWRGNFHCLATGYYAGLTLRYIGIPFIIFMILCMLGTWISDEPMYTLLFGVFAVAYFILMQMAEKKMRIVVYWDGGIMFLDRKDNVIVQMPSSVLRQAVIKRSKIVIPWEGKRYTITRNLQDNEMAVREMLAFYGLSEQK